MIGGWLAHFRIVEKLGAGGMGEVYRAYDQQLDRDVAIKILPAGSFRDETARARLLREARTASRLSHPHICTVFQVGEAEGQAYIAMELVRGRPLSALVAEGPLAAEQVLRYGLQMADALAHAHERGVIHRDLKSANVMVTPEGRIKVLDFGLARRMSQAEAEEATRSLDSLTEAGTVVGTLHYMAPEVLRGRPADARSDLWALGVVLHEMAAGELPFRGKTGFEVCGAILKEPPGPLPERVPPGMQAVIRRCLAKAPGERHQRAEEVRAALETLQSGGRVVAPLLSRRRWLLAAAVLALVLVAVVGVGLWRVARGPRLNSIAVLPLKNLSGDPQQEYFSDGITEALITDLAKIRALKVISRTSAMRYKGTDKPLREIARELDVDAVVEGSALRVGDRVRITAQLIEAKTEQNLWAESYERDLRDVLSLQGEVARAITREIRVAVTQEETKRLARARPVNAEAYEAYLKGRVHLYKQTAQDVSTALEYFQLALEKDPNSALAHTGIATVWGWHAHTGRLPPREASLKRKAAAMRALELDDTLSEAHDGLARSLFWFEWDWAPAEREYKRAIELNPNNAEVRVFYGTGLTCIGRPQEGRAQMERALELDPHNSFFQWALGLQLVWERRYDEAIAQLRKALTTQPDSPDARGFLTMALHQKGLHDEELIERKKRASSPEYVEALDRAYAQGGCPAAWRLAAETTVARSKQTYVAASGIATSYALAGDKERALEWLEKAYQERTSQMVYLQVHPQWDILRSDPRFQDLVRRMKFPP